MHSNIKYKHQIGVGGLELSTEEKKLVLEVLESNRLTYGPKSKEFEKQFSKAHNVNFSLFMNSGTSALHIALATLKQLHNWNDYDEVIIPAVTFVATCNIVFHNKMKPVLVDVDPKTYNIDSALIEEKITDKTRCIIPVHLLGLPASMDPIKQLAKKYNLKIIEDSAECMFASYKDTFVGGLGDIGCFSTYAAHVLITGVGGFATTNNADYAKLMRSMMNHGRNNIYISCSDDQNQPDDTFDEIIDKRFQFVNLGHSFRCTELESAIGIGQLNRKDMLTKRRIEIAHYYNSELSHLSDYIQLPQCPNDRTHCYMLYGLTLRNESKKELVRFLEYSNIETRDLLPLTNQPVYKSFINEGDYPIAKWVNNNGFYIGCHPYMKDDEVEFVADRIKTYFSKK